MVQAELAVMLLDDGFDAAQFWPVDGRLELRGLGGEGHGQGGELGVGVGQVDSDGGGMAGIEYGGTAPMQKELGQGQFQQVLISHNDRQAFKIAGHGNLRPSKGVGNQIQGLVDDFGQIGGHLAVGGLVADVGKIQESRFDLRD